ncbi:MAG: AsnC family transcriptional regulator [Acidobacteriota bacterium]|nr:AsnC family transcriptional regulator [Acidobacteriota bacterium]
MKTSSSSTSTHKPEWTFLTNHAHVLICVHRDPTIRTRDIAQAVGITERATQGIIADLVVEGYLTRERDGRRNVYTVMKAARLRHPVEAQHTVGDLLWMLDRPSVSPKIGTRGRIR